MATITFEKLSEVRKVVSRRRKVQFVITLVAILLNAVVEIISLMALVPFLSVLSSPQAFVQSSTARRLAPMFGVIDAAEAVSLVCAVFAGITIVSAASRTLTIMVTSYFTLSFGADLSRVVFERTLHQPYYSHAKQNSAAVMANVTKNVGAFVNGILNPSVQFMTSSLTVVGILTTLFLINWSVALTASVVFGGAYVALIIFNKSRNSRNGMIIVVAQDDIVKALQEGLGAIRDVIIDGNQNFYARTYSVADRRLQIAHTDNFIRAASPKYILEAVGMFMICVVALVLSKGDSKLLGAVPVLGALAMGAQRLLPAMQIAFASYSSIMSNMYGLDRIVDVLTSEQAPKPPVGIDACGVANQVVVDNVEFRYSLEAPLVLRKVSFKIQRGERIGVIGATGSGKSTTMDLLLGLLQPTSGQILIDGEPLVGDKVFAWQKSLSHVPQVIYLADASIAENIAFGLPKNKIDMDQVHKAAKLAQIAEHIESLDAGYETFVGERGIRLSGGQRQRIGIARALYKNATVLVFDEATSALDDETEAELMKAIDGLSKDLTVIMIAHRLSTVRRCDKILKLHKGKVVAFDTPDVVLGPVPSA
jgi:ABC-type multidrug transport system fused ATPase/permease subunit